MQEQQEQKPKDFFELFTEALTPITVLISTCYAEQYGDGLLYLADCFDRLSEICRERADSLQGTKH